MLTVAALKPYDKPDFVIEKNGEVYLERWYLRPRSKAGPNVYLHHVLKSDQDRHLHNHPWDNTSIILEGGYWEEIPTGVELQTSLIYRPAGSIFHRRAEGYHRLIMYDGMKPCWTLFITGDVQVGRKWGFMTEVGHVDFDEYLFRYRPDQFAKYSRQVYDD